MKDIQKIEQLIMSRCTGADLKGVKNCDSLLLFIYKYRDCLDAEYNDSMTENRDVAYRNRVLTTILRLGKLIQLIYYGVRDIKLIDDGFVINDQYVLYYDTYQWKLVNRERVYWYDTVYTALTKHMQYMPLKECQPVRREKMDNVLLDILSNGFRPPTPQPTKENVTMSSETTVITGGTKKAEDDVRLLYGEIIMVNGVVRPFKTENQTVVISFDTWNSFPVCDIQRRVEDRTSAFSGYLKHWLPKHRCVEAFILPDGTVGKLDGCTRTHGVNIGHFEKPETMEVRFWLVPDLDAAMELYTHFDSQNAVEKSSHRLSGAYRLYFGDEIRASLLREGAVITSLKDLSGKSGSNFNVYEAMKPYIEAIRQINKRMYAKRKKNNRCPAAVLDAMIVTFKYDGDAAGEFWDTYMNGEGDKRGKKRNAVELLLRYVESAEAQLRGATHSNKETMEVALYCYNLYKRKGAEEFRIGHKYVESKQYIETGTVVELNLYNSERPTRAKKTKVV